MWWHTYAPVNWVVIGSGNGLARVEAKPLPESMMIRFIAHWTPGTDFNEIWLKIQTFSLKKKHMKSSSANWRAFSSGFVYKSIRIHRCTYIYVCVSFSPSVCLSHLPIYIYTLHVYIYFFSSELTYWLSHKLWISIYTPHILNSSPSCVVYMRQWTMLSLVQVMAIIWVQLMVITWTNAGLLSTGLLGTHFKEIRIGILSFSSKKMHLKVSSAKMAAILHTMTTSSNGSIFRVNGPLCGEFTGHWWIPHTKARDAKLWCFFFICAWMNGSVNNREAGDLRRHCVHYDVTVMHFSRKTSLLTLPMTH